MVYIGKNKYKYKRMYMSHMIADSLSELHDMANKIGISYKYFQNKLNKPHYDICQIKKENAIKLGAIEISDKLIIQLLKKLYNDN